ncbi:hypothetical protein QVD99_000900 [Batrachochytrium dendrobatidis]|nr:hypothetical protein O5D80_003751 [Batrachochytrium dendrobatidis]KAK5673454.1 hypothetical protein QVD99_000900 [Batrachochytrium dendrobatidis]
MFLTDSLPKASSVYEPILDTGYVPDMLLRMGIRSLLAKRSASLTYPTASAADQTKTAYIKLLKDRESIAIHTKEANEQHYELPTEFFQLCLGERLKYSSCLFEEGAKSLEDAEKAMLDLYCVRSGVKDGMRILDLGCGWGSLTLYLANKYPKSSVVGLSNSASQRDYILDQAKQRSLTNVTIHTADIVEFEMDAEFDRIFSIEMFEHMKNYQTLLAKVSKWLEPINGKLFIHVFAHKSMPYDFKTDEDNSWMAKFFFTGGTMPSQDLFMWFQRDLHVVDRWTINGQNYGKTSQEWLQRMDHNKQKIIPIFESVYGSKEQAYVWFHRWRLFYLSVAETFNYNDGEEWFVVNYLLERK